MDLGQMQDTMNMISGRASRMMASTAVLNPTMVQLNDMMTSLQLMNDQHPDPLVIAREYPNPLPGWGLIRVYDEAGPLLVRVTMMGTEEKVTDSSVWLSREDWFHPSVEFVREVARQFVMYERVGFHFDPELSRYPISMRAVMRAQVWIVDDDGSLSLDSVHREPSLTDDDKEPA